MALKYKSRSKGLKSIKAEFIPDEKWVDILGYEGFYQVSNLSRIKRVSGQSAGCLVKPIQQTIGYQKVTLSKNTVKELLFVHRIVATAFIPNPLNLPEVNHKHGIRNDNRVSELEWVTHSENIKHAHHIGLKVSRIGGDNERAKKVNQLTKHGRFIKTFDSVMDVQRELNISNSNIVQCCLGKRNSSGGFKWKYL